ncbi:MAG: ABC transporter permease [Bacillota bacterium]
MASAIFVQDSDQRAATPPYLPRRQSPAGWLASYAGLAQVMLTEYRAFWWIHVLFGLLMPLGMLFFLKAAGGEIATERAIYLLGGNLTTATVYGPAMIIINKIGWGRQSREFDYWASLPLPKLALLLAMVTVSLALSFPGLLTLWLLGSRMLGLPLAGGLALLPLIPLGALSLVGAGAFLGSYARDGQTANVMANLLMAFVTFLSPTMIPLEALPVPIRLLSSLTPIPYVAGAFRAALAGNFGGEFAYHVGIMVAMGLGCLILVHRKLDWRSQ